MKTVKETLSSILRNKAIVKFLALIFVSEFVRGAYLSYLPLYADKVLGYSVATIGAVICALFLAETLSTMGVGWLLDRFNNRVILLTGLFISFVSLYILQYIRSPLLLILDGGLYGLGFAPVWLMVLGYITGFPQEKRAFFMGIIYSGWLAGLGLGGVIVNFLISKGYPLALNVLIALWAVCLIIGFFIKEGIASKKKEKAPTSMKSVFKWFTGVKYLIPGLIFKTLSISILAPIIPKYFTDPNFIGLSVDQYGLTLGLIGAAAVIFMIVFGKLAKITGVKSLFILGLLFTSIGIIGMGNMRSFYMVLISGLVMGIAYSAVLPSWNTILSNNIPKDNKGLMWGGFSTIEGIGRAVGSLSGGLLGKNLAFNISAVMILGLCLFYYYLNKKNILKI